MVSKDLLRANLVIVADTREKKNQHILDFCELQRIPVERMKLEFGDYSAKFPRLDLDFTNYIAVERKNSLDELANNFSGGRKRFRAEFERLKAANGKMCVLVENGSLDNIINGKMKFSRININSYLASLNDFSSQYGVNFNFCEKRDNVGILIREWLISNALTVCFSKSRPAL